MKGFIMSVKRYNDLTVTELANLTEDQIQHYIDVEIAYEGIIPCEQPILEAEPEIIIKPTVAATECRTILFVKEEDALTFSKMEILTIGYSNKAGYNYGYLVPESECNNTVRPVTYYKKSDVIDLAVQLEKAKRIKNENDSKLKEWNKYQSDTSDIVSSVFKAVSDAKTEVAEIKQAQKVFQKHIELAEGNREVALKFFHDAYKDYGDEWIDSVTSSVN